MRNFNYNQIKMEDFKYDKNTKFYVCSLILNFEFLLLNKKIK